MEYTTLPNSELKVSAVCVGCWQFNGGEQSADKTWPAQPEGLSRNIVDKATELGVNFLDTAEGYLNSESVLGRLLQGRRQNYVIASKFGYRGGMTNYTSEEIEVSLTNSLSRLQTDYIDLYQVHWPNCVQDMGMPAVVQELKRQQAKGRIRSYGLCNFGPQNLQAFLDAGGRPATNQLPYNLLWRGIEYDIMPACKKSGIGILSYSSLQQGLLTGKYLKLEDVPEGRRRTKLFNCDSTSLCKHEGEGAEKQLFQAISDIKGICEKNKMSMPVASLSWCLQDPVKSVIVGASTVEQLEQNVKMVTLDQDVRKQLSDVTEEIKCLFGTDVDMWAKKSRMM